MRRKALFAVAALMPALLALSACQDFKPMTAEDLDTRVVTLPGGQKIRAEVAVTEADMRRGMKYRDSVAPDHGMLFIHGGEGQFSYWMYECRIPLDMIWMDTNRRIVEVVENAQPCPGPPLNCPSYGGHKPARYVLELGGGMAKKYGLQVGQTLDF